MFACSCFYQLPHDLPLPSRLKGVGVIKCCLKLLRTSFPNVSSLGGKKIGLRGGGGGRWHGSPFSQPPPLLGRRAGTISRLTTGDYGGSVYFLILLGGAWMAHNHIFGGCANGGGTFVQGYNDPRSVPATMQRPTRAEPWHPGDWRLNQKPTLHTDAHAQKSRIPHMGTLGVQTK